MLRIKLLLNFQIDLNANQMRESRKCYEEDL